MPEKKTILLVEDEESLRSVMKSALEAAGYNVAVAVDGEEAEAELKKGEAALALLDVVLPKRNGYKVLERLTVAEKARIPILLFSVSVEPPSEERLKELGAADWIVKSDITPEELIKKIKRYAA